jgi:hypothetical protein
MTFEETYRDALVEVKGESPELTRLLAALYDTVPSGKAGLLEIRKRLIELLEFLCSEGGRTDANCKAVDYFFCMGDWSWSALPPAYQEMFADMGGALHDAVADPDIAEAMQATPESLLERARGLS